MILKLVLHWKLILNILMNYIICIINDFPVASEQLKVKDEMLSDYYKKIKDKFQCNSGCLEN